ncbi:CHAT domain-containing protein [Pyxidicoccus parkwayensis]|uniref:CHAT domain-containing protein n=1 Tax=Pyxidicoccus parkwayensis TaxID=2813578 RepID=A0ABX7P0T8_9BACT|nr:zf-HC2 domain-containing protein [Pyxidicoccus parkwaysis]QSQ24633.1 CHAT domain-containing protein [Pyxidicoccus parkwaysis]
MTNDGCDALPRFLDGEMDPEEQVRFREHLAGCETCSEEFRDTLQLDLLGQVTLEEGPVRSRPPEPVAVKRPWWRHRRVGLAAGGALATSLLALVLVLLLRQGRAEDLAWLLGEGGRPLEARLTYAVVDQHYRRYVPERSGAEAAAPVTALPLHELSRLEAREDLHGIATAYLMYGAPLQARAFLERMPPSTARDCDLAVIALERARGARPSDFEGLQQKQAYLEEALQLLDAVLLQEPAHPQALWNRALVLRELGLTLLAAEDFEAVAKLSEPGWSEEAWGQARRLRDDTQARGREWTDVSALMKDLLAESDARLPLDEARAHPGLVRRAFYDAVRSAPSREAVLRLLPLAQVLDALHPGGEAPVLAGYVQRVAARDFSRRGPVARRYGRLARGELPAGGEWVEELRRSGEEDILLGALVRASEAGQAVDVALLSRLALAQEDPWLSLQAELAWAQHDARDTQAWWKAEQRLRTALDTCQGPVLMNRCLALERELTRLYLELHRPAEAFQYAWRGWEHAKAEGEWRFEQEFLQELADVTRFQHAFASARAYLDESLARMPEDCEPRTRAHRTLASVEWERFRPDEARRAIDRALACERPLGLPGAMVLSDLARARPESGDGAALRRALTELRRGGVPPGREALLLFIEGQFELARSLATGQAQLWRAVELAEQWPDDADAREARAHAYGTLIAEAARAESWSEVLALQARQLRLAEVPERCMLSVSLHHERTVVVARGPSGRLLGYYDASRTGPPREGEALVPGRLVDELRACGHVDVLALPPVHGLTGLLPVDLAWSYRVGRRAPLGPPPAFGAARHLVVTDVADPSSLKLPRLPPLQPPRVPDPWRLELRGTQATPSKVLEAMADASEVELHAHGLFSSTVSDASLVVLAPDADGRYALTADRVRRVHLSRSPVVLLATCSAARTAPYVHEPFSLPVAFIEAGASVVLASTTDIPDTAGAFFEQVRELIRCKMRPSVALRDARARWLKEHPGDAAWLAHVLLFE